MSNSIIATPIPGSNMPEFTVSEISQAVKRTLEGNFERIRVRGEVSKPNYHGSGHLYFSLKDEGAVIDAVCWRGTVGRLRLRLEHGMEVIVTGRVSSYPGSSKYQIVIDQAELAGEGALLKMLEERRKRLAAEGLFDAARKRPLPYLPEVIGVITSPTGAVIRDILHRLADRFPRHVLLWPVAVQGENAAAQVVAAIGGFNALQPGGPVPRPDLLIVARGGGSLEDLMPFNDEAVVRAVVASDIPLISAVGHETDTTLIDFAADRRAPTPTAAAEMAVPVRGELLGEIGENGLRLARAAQRLIAEQKMRLEGLARGLIHPARLLEDMAQRLDGWTERLGQSLKGFFAARTEQVSRASARLRDAATAHPPEAPGACGSRVNLAPGYAAGAGAEAAAFRRRDGAVASGGDRGTCCSADACGSNPWRACWTATLMNGCWRAASRWCAMPPTMPYSSARAVTAGAALRLQFADGQVPVTATGGAGKPPASTPPSSSPAPKRKPTTNRDRCYDFWHAGRCWDCCRFCRAALRRAAAAPRCRWTAISSRAGCWWARPMRAARRRSMAPRSKSTATAASSWASAAIARRQGAAESDHGRRHSRSPGTRHRPAAV